MTQVLLTVCLLFVLICFAYSAPVPCAAGTNALSYVEETDIEEAAILADQCDPNSTCEMKCPCSKSIYFDLSKQPGWSSTSTQQLWKSLCGTRTSVSTYISKEVGKAADSLCDSTSKGFASLIKNPAQRIVMRIRLLNLLDGVFQTVYTRYQQICHGGQRMNQVHLFLLQTVFNIQLNLRSLFFKPYPNYDKLKDKAKEIFDKFIDKINGGAFEYCQCDTFMKKTSPLKYALAKAQCPKCSITLEMESDNATVDEYMDE